MDAQQATPPSVSTQVPVCEVLVPTASETQKVAASLRDSETDIAVLGYN